jgi:hypothetical protein
VAHEGGVEALKLYVMVGLPTETDADVDGIADLATKVRARLMAGGRPKVGRILVSINPFVPKPWTPFQWEPMGALAELEAEARARPPRAPRDAGAAGRDREPARGVPADAALARRPPRRADPRAPARAPRRLVGDVEGAAGRRGRLVDPDRFVLREWDADELLPWDFVDHQVDKRYLLAERRKALRELQTPPCDTHTCHSCGAC